MPWRGPEYPGEFPTLGYEVAQWVQDSCVVPDREDAGAPFLLTEEQLRFLLFHYALDPVSGRWRYERGSQLIRPRKWGKAPLSAVMVCAEAAGPVRFDGWDANGEPVGRSIATPWIQCVACSQDQVANVWRVLLPIIQLGSLDADIPDTGDTRINLSNGGRIEPVTASARSRFGQRTTFAVMDETHLWRASNGGHELASTISQNLAGTSGRFVETTNAFDPAEASVAQRTFESNDPHVFKDDAPAPHGSVRNVRERDKVLEAVYGDSIHSERNPRGWIDKRRIHVEIDALLELNEGATAERMFMNRKLASEGAAFNPERLLELVKPRQVPQGAIVTLGIDGARHQDALAVVATDAKTGYQWPVVIVERPEHAPEDYEHDLDAVYHAVAELVEGDKLLVWRAYCDDQYIVPLLERLQNRFGQKRFVTWHTGRQKNIAWAVRRYEEAIAAGDVSFHSDERFLAHLRNARRRMLTVLDDRQVQMHTLTKDHIRSQRKIDAAMAAVLSWEARGVLIESGVSLDDIATPQPQKPPDVYRANHAPAVGSFAPVVGVGGMSDME